MRTTITIDEAIFTDLMRFTQAKTRTEAINRALAEWVRRKKIENLKGLRGKLDIAEDLEDFRRLGLDETAYAASTGSTRICYCCSKALT